MKKIFCYYDIDQWGGYRFHIKTPKYTTIKNVMTYRLLQTLMFTTEKKKKTVGKSLCTYIVFFYIQM